MAKLIKKLFGDRPERVAVLSEIAEFDVEGIAEVSDEAAEVFLNSPGYEAVEDVEDGNTDGDSDHDKELEKVAGGNDDENPPEDNVDGDGDNDLEEDKDVDGADENPENSTEDTHKVAAAPKRPAPPKKSTRR